MHLNDKALLILVIMIGLSSRSSAQNGETLYPTIFSDHFEDTTYSESIWTPRDNYSFCPGKEGRGITMQAANGSRIITTHIPVDSIRGGAVVLQANIKADSISDLPNPWNGIKVMLNIVLDDSTSLWPQVNADSGTFDWTNGSVLVNVPSNAVKMVLYLGLDKCTGRVWLDDVIIKLVKSPSSYPGPRSPGLPIDKFHNAPSFRGAMVGTHMTEKDLNVLGNEWNANVIRWQLGGTKYPQGLKTPDYDSVLDSELTKLDTALPWCRESGLNVIVDLHSLSMGWEYSVAAQTKLVEVWKEIASRYKGDSTVWAYDIANEPNTTDGNWGLDSLLIWEDLAQKVALAIRAIDPDKPIIVESSSGDPAAFSNLRPLSFSIPHIIYSAHMYKPLAFTHQTLYNYTESYDYPGTIDGVYYDKAELERILQPVMDFQNKYRVPILIGEFSAIRWAPDNSAYNYLRDCIQIFEQCNWDWCYHAFREWQGWSAELGEDRYDLNPTPNDREQLLRSYFAKNVKTTGVSFDSSAPIMRFELADNHPNPFNPSTVISYRLSSAGNVTLKVYDVLGREVATLVNARQNPGPHSVTFDGSRFSSGIYFCRLVADGHTATDKMLLLK